MTEVDQLRAEVAAAYAAADPPTWPDPHPGRTSPAEEEYSRVSDPQRYRITRLRAEAWAAVLSKLPGVAVEDLIAVPEGRAGQEECFDRGVRLTSTAPGTVPMLLLQRDVVVSPGEPALSVLQISVVRPSMVLERWPDCGCDACDSGSDDLIEAIDQTVITVVRGPLVVLRGSDWYAQWSPDGGSSGGDGTGPDHGRVMELCRRLADGQDVRLPARTEAVVSRGWIS